MAQMKHRTCESRLIQLEKRAEWGRGLIPGVRRNYAMQLYY